MLTKEVSDQTFESDVLGASELVLVDFWAEWCGPCRMIAPTLEEIASEMEGKVTVAKINIDENPKVPSKYNVRAIPTLMLFKNGELVSSQMGANHTKSKLVSWINQAA